MSHIDTLTNQGDWCNFCDFSKKYLLFKKLGTVTCVIHVTCVISLKVSLNGLILIIKPTSVIGVTFVISQTKFIFSKLRTVTCVICVTCVISSLGSPNGLILIF